MVKGKIGLLCPRKETAASEQEELLSRLSDSVYTWEKHTF
jgi:hypothetical protein